MVKANVKLDISFFKQFKTVATESGKKSMAMALNDSLKSGKTALKREIVKSYNIKQKDIDTNTKIFKASPSNLKGGKLVVSSRLLTVGTSTHFSITPRNYMSQQGIKVSKRKKATVTIKKKAKKRLEHAFIANPAAIKGGNTMLWIREKRNRSITPVKSVSIPQMVSNHVISDAVQKNMVEQYSKRFEHYANRYMGKVK